LSLQDAPQVDSPGAGHSSSTSALPAGCSSALDNDDPNIGMPGIGIVAVARTSPTSTSAPSPADQFDPTYSPVPHRAMR
jgi:hypothetical protein